MTVNGRIQPHGLPTKYWFEYGPDVSYGKSTAVRALPPTLSAHYHEDWNNGTAGWRGGMSAGKDLRFVPDLEAGGGFVRFTEPSRDDPNHTDGIGTLHLASYFYPGLIIPQKGRTAFLGGGNPDFRDALVTLKVRGRNFVANGSELLWWTQHDLDVSQQSPENIRRANWAYTGYSLTEALASGRWENVSYRLENNSHNWTYAGNNLSQNRALYVYDSIDTSLGDLNGNFFHLLAFVDPAHPPTGEIDFDDLTLTYRNYSLLYPANGGRLVSAASGSDDDPARLTDGWRNGAGRMWASGNHPTAPQEFVYRFAAPVTISCVQVYQNTEWPTKDLEVLTSTDGVTWVELLRQTMEPNASDGPNFAFVREANLTRLAAYAKIRILSGYRAEKWGLGGVEVFGTGAQYGTDDDWYNVNLDIPDLAPGRTYHFRLVGENGNGRSVGLNFVHTTPATRRPHVATREAKRISATTAVLTGRLTSLGHKTTYYFEYGPDQACVFRTPDAYGGMQETPRLVFAGIAGLARNTFYHYRLVGVNSEGMSRGEDASFRTGTE